MQKTLSLDEQMEDLYLHSLYSQRGDNRKDLDRMKKMLCKAMKNQLTDRQRSCLSMYYFDGLKMWEIGEALGLSTSTVSRHIAAAIVKLKKLSAFVD